MPRKQQVDQQWLRLAEAEGSGGRSYPISLHKGNGTLGCGCTGWRTHRHCKHLNEFKAILRYSHVPAPSSGIRLLAPAGLIKRVLDIAKAGDIVHRGKEFAELVEAIEAERAAIQLASMGGTL